MHRKKKNLTGHFDQVLLWCLRGITVKERMTAIGWLFLLDRYRYGHQ
jgi:hypothetical protein